MLEDRVRDIAVTGSSGLVGGRLAAALAAQGHRIRRLVRRAPSPGGSEIHWNPVRGEIDAAGLEGVEAVVHLAGESIASRRWSPAVKEAIRESRVGGTRLLCDALARMKEAPRVLVAASAIGYYGDRGDELLDEDSPPGTDYLAEVCRAWERATEPARRAGVRVVNLRIGIVLAASGGALAQALTPFKLGVGGPLGGGRQFMSWIGLEDLTQAIRHAILTEALDGPVNAVAPEPVRNVEFTRTLGRVLRRPTVFPMPAFAVRLLFGEMGEALLLHGARIRPRKLEATGFRFLHPRLESALRSELGRRA